MFAHVLFPDICLRRFDFSSFSFIRLRIPIRYPREEIIEGEIYAGADRHNGEIAAFHLGRLLGLSMVPLAVGRKVSLKREILGKSSRKLAATFLTKGIFKFVF